MSLPENGILVCDKPPRATSREVVNFVQRCYPPRTKVGHAGTLDPLASGVLVVCIGSATKLVEQIQNLTKVYVTVVRFGATSNTDDADGTIVPNLDALQFREEDLRKLLPKFVGEIDQLPPAFSALKVGGKRAHDLARRGHEVPLVERKVRVDSIELKQFSWPFAEVEIICGKGTYVRSIARDLGAQLGTGGLVQELRRTRIGPFTTDNAVSLNATREELQGKILPPRMDSLRQ
jgi:tRNA pseudouridine55 synthase